MLHLIGPGGTPVLVGDGLGVPVDNWQVGDVIIQRHRLDIPAEAPAGEYSLHIGAYWLDSLERWSVRSGDQVTGDVLKLPPVAIK
jgi:hypothetical protein